MVYCMFNYIFDKAMNICVVFLIIQKSSNFPKSFSLKS